MKNRRNLKIQFLQRGRDGIFRQGHNFRFDAGQVCFLCGNRIPAESEDGYHDAGTNYSDFFPAFLILAQRAFAKADSLALAAALIVLFFAGALAAGFTGFTAGFAVLTFAHRALAAAEILALAAALIFNFSLGSV